MCPAFTAVKKGTSGISFESSIGPSHPISEIVTSHVCRLLKRLEMRVTKKMVCFFNQESEGTVSYSECQMNGWLQ